jgi:hypothetical protein
VSTFVYHRAIVKGLILFIEFELQGFSVAGGESGIRTHGTVRVVDNPPTSKAGMVDRTSFAPETTSPERNERDQSPTKNTTKSTKLTVIPPLITVWAQLQVPSDDNEINGETGTRLGRDGPSPQIRGLKTRPGSCSPFPSLSHPIVR